MATGYAASGREMTVGGVMGRAFGAIGAAPIRFVGTSLVLSAAPAMVSQLIARGYAPIQPTASPAEAFASRPWALLIGWWVGYLVLYMLAKAILFRTTVAVEDGEAQPFGRTVTAALRRIAPLVIAAVLYYLGIWVGLILLIVPGVILALMWAVVGPVVVLEGTGITTAFGRSARLTKGARLRIFGLYLVVFVTYLVLLFAIGAGYAFGFGASGIAEQSLLSQVLGVLLGATFLAAWSAIQASLYLALRDWKDGASGEQLADIFA